LRIVTGKMLVSSILKEDGPCFRAKWQSFFLKNNSDNVEIQNKLESFKKTRMRKLGRAKQGPEKFGMDQKECLSRVVYTFFNFSTHVQRVVKVAMNLCFICTYLILTRIEDKGKIRGIRCFIFWPPSWISFFLHIKTLFV